MENIDAAGEKAGKTTAHETLLMRAGWKRHHCFGAAVQKGEFRVVSGALDTFKEFIEDIENREKADIREEARKVAVELAVELAGVEDFSKVSFYLDPLVPASTLDYFCSFDGGMEDSCATKEMLEHSLEIYQKALGRGSLEGCAHFDESGHGLQ